MAISNIIPKEMSTLAGVIGYPVRHSKSPLLHNFWIRKYGLNAYYVPLEVSRLDFAEIVGTLPKMGFRGVNITIPHKESALEYCHGVSDRAALIGAANTLRFGSDGLIFADNTDGYGFTQNIRERVPTWRASAGPTLVIGAGGASRAIIHALLEEGVAEVFLVNRTRDRAEFLRQEFGAKVIVHDWFALDAILRDALTVVN
ncbi:MAG: shikimate dehydrogenase, partial [Albidovulum sp.]|nr:shikimate dehydrogenase [Albidovulum sp.]